MTGWVKLHRDITEWRWYRDVPVKTLFTHLLLMANHETRYFEVHEVKRGQLVVGRRELAIQTGLSEQEVRTAITKLKSTNEIAIKTTTKYSIITVANYEVYQKKEEGSNQPSTNHQPASNQPSTTNKNERIKERSDDEGSATPIQILDWLQEHFGARFVYIGSVIHSWLEWGADFHLDIKPVAERYLKRKLDPPRSLEWLSDDVTKSIKARALPMPEIKNYRIPQQQEEDWKTAWIAEK